MIERYYGTLGPACKEETILRQMFQEGMTGVRLNLSHSNLNECEELISNYFKASVGILDAPELVVDLRGPELRIGRLEQTLELKEGQKVFLFSTADEELLEKKQGIPVPAEVLTHIKPQQQVLLDDGKILLEAEAVSDVVKCSILRGGHLTSGKSIALQGCEIHLPTLTLMDKENLRVAKKYGVTGVMLPFVRGVEDLRNLRQALEDADARDIKIFAKIENQEGVAKLEELVPACDEIVIARGDLGNSVPLWELPVIQEKIATACKQYKRPFMVVTQMLASMEHHPIPTRAEVSDIYHAVSQGASSVMLTAETAVGEYPVESIMYLVKTGEAAKKVNANPEEM